VNAVLPYILWCLAVLGVVTLWFVALSEIGSHARRGVFTAAQLAYMGAAVSVVAVMAVTTLSTVLTPDWEATRATADGATGALAGCEKARGTFVFSFGLEQPSYAASDCAARHP
jgi:hypothetical protein